MWADSAAEALTGLTGGTYDQTPHNQPDQDKTFAVRHELAAAFAGQLQTDAVIDSPDRFDFGAQPSDVISALTANRRAPFHGVRQADGTVTYQWDCPVPLVLVDTHYAPFTDCPQPCGNIIWIRAATDTSVLTSLHDAGAIHYQNRTNTPNHKKAV